MTRAKSHMIANPTPMRSAPAFIVKAYGRDLRNPALVTTHTTEMSAFVEVEALQRRMKRFNGSILRAELIDCRPVGGLTNTNLNAGTQIEWSWVKKE